MFRFILPLFIFITLFIPAKLEAKEFEVFSKITKATVYKNRATVTREASINIPKGTHALIFKGLTNNIMTDSIRVKGESFGGKVIFGAVSHKMVMSKELIDKKEKALNDKLQEIEDKIKTTNAVQAALTSKKNFIKNLSKQANLRSDEAIAELKLNTNEWSAAAEVIFKNISDIGKADLELQIKKRELNKEANKIRRELSQLRRGSKSSYIVNIPVEVSQDTKMQVKLSYQVTNATWRPIYDARLTTKDGQRLEIIQYGSVSQRTGEDWSSIELTLSTAQPQRGASLPKLRPVWVDIWKESKNKGFGATSVQSLAVDGALEEGMPSARMMRASSFDKVKRAEFKTAQINNSGFVSEYKIIGKSDIPTGGTNTKLMVGKFATESIIQAHIKPQISTNAFLVANAKLKGDAPILAGQVSLFRDGAYVGKSSLPLLRPDERHELYFGIDDQISVKRKILKDMSKEEGLISKDKVKEKHFVTEIENFHKTPIQIIVKETIPASRNERIKIEILDEHTSKNYQKDAENIKGMVKWDFNIAPKSKKELKLGWRVTWPKDFNLSGI